VCPPFRVSQTARPTPEHIVRRLFAMKGVATAAGVLKPWTAPKVRGVNPMTMEITDGLRCSVGSTGVEPATDLASVRMRQLAAFPL
jgi:hypothetical protein